MGTYDTRGGTPQHDPAGDYDPYCDGCLRDPEDCVCACVGCGITAIEVYSSTDYDEDFDHKGRLCPTCKAAGVPPSPAPSPTD